MKDRLPLIVFFLSFGALSFLYGFASSSKTLFPASILRGAEDTVENLATNWRNDFGLEPTRLLVANGKAESGNLEMGRPAAANVVPLEPQIVVTPGAAEGNRFISGLTPAKDTLTGATLLDRSGREIHYWPIDFDALSPGGADGSNTVYLHGIQPLKDGSIVVNFDNGDLLARIDPCGETLWITPGRFHHVVTESYDGTLWTWENPEYPDPRVVMDATRETGYLEAEFLVQIDAETGEKLREISLEKDIIAANGLFGQMAIRTNESANEVIYCCDPFHPNDVEALSPELAPAFPMFTPGDLLVSLRNLNLVAVLDPDTMAPKWSRTGPWHRQHDPDFLPDGTISVLNNNMGVGTSQIVVVNPATGEDKVVFDGARDNNFYTWRRGRHQQLPNGNIIIAESERGRVIEVDRRGDVVWLYENVFDAERNGLINDAVVLPADFFEEGALACPAGEAKTAAASPSPRLHGNAGGNSAL